MTQNELDQLRIRVTLAERRIADLAKKLDAEQREIDALKAQIDRIQSGDSVVY